MKNSQMTKSNYELVSNVIRRVATADRRIAENEVVPQAGRDVSWQCFYTAQDIARKLSIEFEHNNPKFDRNKFLEQCGVKD